MAESTSANQPTIVVANGKARVGTVVQVVHDGQWQDGVSCCCCFFFVGGGGGDAFAMRFPLRHILGRLLAPRGRSNLL